MLQTIREHTQGWIASTVIAIIILTFALWGIHSYFVGGGNNNVVAQVGDVEIQREQLNVAYERLRREAQSRHGTAAINTKDESGLKDRALQNLIDIEVLTQASIKQGFRISDLQVDNYLESMPEFQENGHFSLERFQKILSSSMLNTGEFLRIIKISLLIEQPKLGITLSAFALPNEAKDTIALVNQERDIDYINIPLSYFLAKATTVTPQRIKAYYDQHQQDFMTPERVNIEYLELSLKDLAAQIHPSDADLEHFYNENINTYIQPTAWKISSITIPIKTTSAANAQIDEAKAKNVALGVLQALKQGKDFASLAQTYNKNKSSSSDWLTLNKVPNEWQKAVTNLTKKGQTAAVIKTNEGFVILKATDIKESKIQPFTQVKTKVLESYARLHAEEKLAELRDQLASITYEHPESLTNAASSLNLKVKSSELFTKEKGGNDISQHKKIREISFSNDVLNLQNNSDVIQLNPETLIVLRVKSHIVPTLMPLKDLAKQIEDKLKTQDANELAEKLSNEFKTKLQTGTDPNVLATANKFNWDKLGYVSRYATKVDSAILDAAFRLPHPSQSKIVYGVARIPTGYAIIALKGIKDGSLTDSQEVKVFQEQVQNSDGILEYELYKQSQTKNTKIKIPS